MSGVLRVRSLANLLILAIAPVVSQSSARAHVLDEYVQATLVDIDASKIRLRINLTPGVEVAEQVIALIDSDSDGAISPLESRIYSQLMMRDLAVKLDGRDVKLHLKGSQNPSPEKLRSGEGIIQVEFEVASDPLADGEHTLAFHNRHLPEIGVYLFNAAAPRAEAIQIFRQTRSANQSSGEIKFGRNVPVVLAMPMTGRRVAVIGVAALAVVLLGAAFARVFRRRPVGRT